MKFKVRPRGENDLFFPASQNPYNSPSSAGEAADPKPFPNASVSRSHNGAELGTRNRRLRDLAYILALG